LEILGVLDAHHRAVRHRPSDHPGRHALCGARRARRGGGGRRRHRFISAHTQPSGKALLAEIGRARSLTRNPIGVNLTILPHLKGARPEDTIEAIIAGGVQFVETAGANPARYFPRLKAAGLRIIHKCTSIRFALKAESLGADAICIAGFEAAATRARIRRRRSF
jgi:nitronate monooxygenase